MINSNTAFWAGLALATVLGQSATADTTEIFASKPDYHNGVLSEIDLTGIPVREGGPDCAQPEPIDSVPYSDSGDTTGAPNTIATVPLACNGNYTTVAGPDHVYSLEVGPNNDLTFSLTTSSSTYDPSIYLVSDCSDGNSCVVGADDCFGASTGGNPCGSVSDESFSVSDLTPGIYHFYVDSFYAAASPNGSGPYALDVTGTLGDLLRSIGGTVTGLQGSGLEIQNNGGDDLAIATDGPFTFATELNDGQDYDVTVLTQPAGPNQECVVSNGAGTVSGADVDDIGITCSTFFSVGGTVSGLQGSGLELQNNGGDDLAIAADGGFAFATELLDGSAYDVSVAVQPSSPAQTCAVANGAGTISGANISDVAVSCTNLPPGVSLSTGNIDLGAVFAGSQSSGTVTVTNTGTGDLEISSISDPGAPFSISGGTCTPTPTIIVPGGSCDIVVNFAPTSEGTQYSSSFDIVSDAASSPDTVGLTGTSQQAVSVPSLDARGLALLVLLMAVAALFAFRVFALRG